MTLPELAWELKCEVKKGVRFFIVISIGLSFSYLLICKVIFLLRVGVGRIYLEPIVRSCMSGFAVTNQTQIEKGSQQLKQDLESGIWGKQYGFLKQYNSIDFGYRFIVTN
ncbi:MAG: hypothetical protein KAI17_27510 [Thiotrichaceae bacterium]|nr:hypothetical protein [Thiotrichaceae bacterium]